jgi:hypothetical protein
LLAVNAGYVFEEAFLQKYAERHADVRLHLLSVAGSDFIFEPLTSDAAEPYRSLERDFEDVMPHGGSRAQVVRFSPVFLPAVTVLTKEAKARRELEEVKESAVVPEFVRKIVQDVLGDKPHVPVVLYLNADNSTIQQLAKMAGSPVAQQEAYKAAILAAYNNAILLAQHLMTPENAQAAFASSNNIIRLFIEQVEQSKQTQAQLTALDLRVRELENPDEMSESRGNEPRHIVCFIAAPFRDDEIFAFDSVLVPALRCVVEKAPFFWQLVRADDKYLAETVEDSVARWMQRADVYVADMSTLNANVMMELGYMQWAESARVRPRIVLERVGAGGHLSDLGGFIKIRYPHVSGNHAIDDLAKALSAEFAKIQSVQELNRKKDAHYLSALCLQSEFGIQEGNASLISQKFPTMECLIAADIHKIIASVPTLRRGMAEGVQRDVAERLAALRAQP